VQKQTLGEVKKNKRSFDGKLCLKYLHQNYVNLIIFYTLESEMFGMFFETQCSVMETFVN